MGVGQSKIPYNVENPRRVRDLKTFHKIIQEYKALANDNFDLEVFANFTAPKFRIFMIGAMMFGIPMVMNDPERGNKLNNRWKPWISILNKWTEPIEAELYMNRPTRIMEGERITIQPGEIGRLPLPKEVDFNRDDPLNPIMNDRDVCFYNKTGQSLTVSCNRLNYGMTRGDFVLNSPTEIDVCDEINENDPSVAPKRQNNAAELNDFMAEANDPSCPDLTEDQIKTIMDFTKKCFSQALDKQPE
jgi:hypothetical protein